MLIGRFGKMFLQTGVEGNEVSAQDFVLVLSGMMVAMIGMCIHIVSWWMAFSAGS